MTLSSAPPHHVSGSKLIIFGKKFTTKLILHLITQCPSSVHISKFSRINDSKISTDVNKITLKESFITGGPEVILLVNLTWRLKIVINRTVSSYNLSLTVELILPAEETYGYFCKKNIIKLTFFIIPCNQPMKWDSFWSKIEFQSATTNAENICFQSTINCQCHYSPFRFWNSCKMSDHLHYLPSKS